MSEVPSWVSRCQQNLRRVGGWAIDSRELIDNSAWIRGDGEGYLGNTHNYCTPGEEVGRPLGPFEKDFIVYTTSMAQY